MYSKISLKEFLRKFDTVILDTEYRDLSQIILLCEDLQLQWIMLITKPWTLNKWLKKYQPERGVILFDLNTCMTLPISSCGSLFNNLPFWYIFSQADSIVCNPFSLNKI